MFGAVAKFLLVLSAIAPVGLVYAWVCVTEKRYDVAIILVAGSVFLVLICLFLLGFAKKKLERFPFRAAAVEAADRENIAFMLLYLSPLFTAQLDDLNLSVLIPALLVFILMTATGYNYHFNPLLDLLRWHFYRVSSAEGVTYVLVTKKQLRNAGQIKSVGQLTDYILIDLEEANGGKSTRYMSR